MKQVWQTVDGGIFESYQEAVDWESQHYQIQDLSQFLYHNTCGIDESDCKEIANVLVEHYNVSAK